MRRTVTQTATNVTAPDRAPGPLGRVPLAGNYPAAVALALLALCPFIVLTTASALFQQELLRALGTSMFGLQLAAGLSNATYAFGAVAAADLTQRIPRRKLFLSCEGLFVAGSLLAALAPGVITFAAGRVIQGLATGMLLVAALPPLVTNHGADKLPTTAAVVNLGLFGMVTLGPLVGGLVGSYGGWRLLFVAVAVLGGLGMTMGFLAFEGNVPPAPGAGFDWQAAPLAAVATVLPFFAVSWLSRSSFTSPGFLVPLVAGLLALGALIVSQYRKRRALMPLGMISNTLPVTGIGTAMVAGAAFTALLELTVVYLLEVAGRPPVVAGALLGTQLLGIAAAAWLFKRVLPTRWIPVLAFSGLATVAAGAALLLALPYTASAAVVAVAGLLLGFGAGAGVAPGLFMAGLSAPSTKLGPTFALVELLRSEAAFLLAPVLLHVAVLSSSLAAGLNLTIGITLALTVVSGPVLVLMLLLGGARPHAPDLEGWLSGETTAFHSPRVAATLRGG